jgi:hypothetical protein
MRSDEEEDATAFGPPIQVSACAACGTARSSARKRRKVSAATFAAKSSGSLRLVIRSTAAKISAGRRP